MNDRLNLMETDRKVVARILNTVAQGIEVWVYGSRIIGTAWEPSDLDLVLRGRDLDPIDVTTLAAARQAFSESNLPILVGFLNCAQIPESFREAVLADYMALR